VFFGASFTFGRHFALEVDAGHVTGSALRTFYPAFSVTYGDGTHLTVGDRRSRDTWDIWYGSIAFVGSVDLKRVRLWGGVGFAFGDDNGEQHIFASDCTAPERPSMCDFFVTDHTYPHYFSPELHLTGGLDVRLNQRFAAFVKASNLDSRPVLAAGVRVAVRSVDRLVPAILSATPRTMAPGSAVAPLKLSRGTLLWITTADGAAYAGELVALSPDEVSVRTRTGMLAVPFARITRIDKEDSLANGVGKGALIGGGSMLGIALLAGLFGGADESPDVDGGLFITAIGAGVGALAGAVIDALIRRPQTVFSSAGSRTVTVSPILGRHHTGLGVILRW
jgi:hypothetical protein